MVSGRSLEGDTVTDILAIIFVLAIPTAALVWVAVHAYLIYLIVTEEENYDD